MFFSDYRNAKKVGVMVYSAYLSVTECDYIAHIVLQYGTIKWDIISSRFMDGDLDCLL